MNNNSSAINMSDRQKEIVTAHHNAQKLFIFAFAAKMPPRYFKNRRNKPNLRHRANIAYLIVAHAGVGRNSPEFRRMRNKRGFRHFRARFAEASSLVGAQNHRHGIRRVADYYDLRVGRRRQMLGGLDPLPLQIRRCQPG